MKNKSVISIVIFIMGGILLAWSVSLAASTIGSNITTAGTLTVSGAASLQAAATVGTDLTVTSGTRIGTGSTPDAFTVLADDSLFIEGQLEVDGAARLDGTLTVTGAATLSSTLSVATTTIDADGQEVLLVRRDGDAKDVFIVDTTNLITTASGTLKVINYTSSDLVNVLDGTTEVFSIIDGGKVGMASSTPLGDLSLGGATGTTTIKANDLCFENSRAGAALVHFWFRNDGSWASSSGPCEP